MSGLVGLLNFDGQPVDRGLLAAMTHSMAFRGPDHRAWWADGAVGLGHALLRESGSGAASNGGARVAGEQQPLTLDGQVWIVADARLDGRAGLLEALRARRQESAISLAANAPDAALVLRAYLAWGESCLAHLQGDFAFAIWDGRERRLFCARDQFGVAPFYYARLAGGLLFGNTLGVIHLHPGVPETLNEQAIADLLVFGANQDVTTTAFAGIQRLAPSHSLLWQAGELRCQRYWSLPQPDIKVRPARETIETFTRLLEQAVADRLPAGRTATTLSGGMDSSSLAVVAQAQLAARGGADSLLAYTIRADHILHDEEGHYASLVAEAAGIPLEFVPVAPDAIPAAAGTALALNPEPGFIPGLSTYGQIMERVAAHGRVLLAGFGGDPLLNPTPGYLVRLAQAGRWGRLAGALGQHLRWHGRLPPPYLRSTLRQQRGQGPRLGTPPANWIDPGFAARVDLKARRRRVLEAEQVADQRLGMASLPFWSNLFAHGDPGFSGTPVRLRYPFFDARLVTFVLSVAPIPWFERKLLLREAMRGRLPESVRRRPKTPASGNALQLQTRQAVPGWMIDLAGTPELAPYANRERLLQIVRSPAEASLGEFRSAFTALSLAYWLRHWRRPEHIDPGSLYHLEEVHYDSAS